MAEITSVAAGVVKAIARVRSWRQRPALRILPFNERRDRTEWMVPDLGRLQRVFTVQVENTGKRTAARCVGILTVKRKSEPNAQPRDYVLHWAETPYEWRTSGANPVDIGPEGHRLDVVYSYLEQSIAGCWVATTSALRRPDLSRSDYLAPGEYECTVTIHAENAATVAATYTVTSGARWRDLSVSPVG
jgi:hypothetical protein